MLSVSVEPLEILCTEPALALALPCVISKPGDWLMPLPYMWDFIKFNLLCSQWCQSVTSFPQICLFITQMSHHRVLYDP